MFTYPLRVLVCEGKQLRGDAVARLLRRLGCREVLLAKGGREAIALLKDFGAVDIALVDLEMEDMDCLDFLQALGYSQMVDAVILSSGFVAGQRQVIDKIVASQGLTLLGEIATQAGAPGLEVLLSTYVQPRLSNQAVVTMARQQPWG